MVKVQCSTIEADRHAGGFKGLKRKLFESSRHQH